MREGNKEYGQRKSNNENSFPKKLRTKAAYDRLANYLLDKFIKENDPLHFLSYQAIKYDYFEIEGKIFCFRIPEDINLN